MTQIITFFVLFILIIFVIIGIAAILLEFVSKENIYVSLEFKLIDPNPT